MVEVDGHARDRSAGGERFRSLAVLIIGRAAGSASLEACQQPRGAPVAACRRKFRAGADRSGAILPLFPFGYDGADVMRSDGSSARAASGCKRGDPCVATHPRPAHPKHRARRQGPMSSPVARRSHPTGNWPLSRSASASRSASRGRPKTHRGRRHPRWSARPRRDRRTRGHRGPDARSPRSRGRGRSASRGQGRSASAEPARIRAPLSGRGRLGAGRRVWPIAAATRLRSPIQDRRCEESPSTGLTHPRARLRSDA